jgi:GNAT superfamily N-acetyltransferase
MITRDLRSTAAEQERLLAFVRRDPERHRHIVDLAYRLCSPSAQIPENTCVWTLPGGEIVGFAIIQREFWTIDYGTSMEGDSDVFPAILTWANERMEKIAKQEQEEFPDGIMNFFDCFVEDHAHQAQLQAAGYRPYSSWYQVHRWQRLDRDLAAPALPAGYTLRPLAGTSEAAVCAALQRTAFDSTSMTTDWRLHILHSPDYTPDLDLVVALPTGELVAFCLGWQVGAQGQIEPIGVHPQYQRRGLGRVLIRHCLQQMWRRGIEVAHIEHNGAPDSAGALYSAEGFAHPRHVTKYMRRWYASTSAP